MQKEIPILFSTPMVQAILAGRNTQTRRIINPQPYIDRQNNFCWEDACYGQNSGEPLIQSIASPIPVRRGKTLTRTLNPFGKPGDVLYVRETWGQFAGITDNDPIIYRADGCWEAQGTEGPVHVDGNRWKPSIHMPKSAARIWLQVESVRVERLQDISEEDAIAEGIDQVGFNCEVEPEYKDYVSPDMKRSGASKPWGLTPVGSFKSLWQSINADRAPWESNPWVWVVSYKVLSTTGRP